MGYSASYGLIKSDLASVKESILQFSEDIQGKLETLKINECNILHSRIKVVEQDITLVRFPNLISEPFECTKYLSGALNCQALLGSIYDSESWILYVFENGIKRTSYMSDPLRYDENPKNWEIDVIKLCEFNRSKLEDLENYFEKKSSEIDKAYETDKYAAGSPFQLYDLFSSICPKLELSSFYKGFKKLLTKKTLDSIQEEFLTIDHIKKTKKYTSELMKVSKAEVHSIFDEDEIFENLGSCPNCNFAFQDIVFYFSLDTLTLQIIGKCTCIQENKEYVIMNYAFIHKMKEVVTFLNK
mgnify:CR=1 FL=1